MLNNFRRKQSLTMHVNLNIIAHALKFCVFNFRSKGRLRKSFNNENFPIYGNAFTEMGMWV